jgi:hypothetical protein
MIKGYKASYNGKCLDQLYEVGQTYTLKNKPRLCNYGFHFCKKADDVLKYYNIIDSNFVLFEVEAIGDVENEFDKSCTNKIKIVRIVPKEEYNEIFKDNKFEFLRKRTIKSRRESFM